MSNNVSDLHEQVQSHKTRNGYPFDIFGQAQITCTVTRLNFVGAYAKARDGTNDWFF